MPVAVIETTFIGLGLSVDDLVGADICSSGESLAADFAKVRTFTGMQPFVHV